MRSSIILNTENIIKNKSNDVGLWGYSTRNTGMHFIDNGFVVDNLSADAGYYVYPRNIYGINF